MSLDDRAGVLHAKIYPFIVGSVVVILLLLDNGHVTKQ
jgi:hypothetical protein